MPSAMDISRRYISRRPFILEGLSKNVINYSKLAREISSEKSISFDAVLMACRRIASSLRKNPEKGLAGLLKNSRKTISVGDKKASIRIDIDVRKDELHKAVEILNY